MFLATDVHYDDSRGTAVAAAVGFWRARDAVPTRRFTTAVEVVAPYEPGHFYRRELPCLLPVIERAAASNPISTVLVDGHVWLREGEPGLGHHLWGALGRGIAVVGVAKRPFRDGVALEVTRGASTTPLYVSAAGVDATEAATFVRRMHGPHRIPTMLRLVDDLCRGR